MALQPATAGTGLGLAEPAAPPRAGARYSRFVALMKVVLPLIALVLVAMVAIWPQLKEAGEGFRIEISRMGLGAAGGHSMLNARYAGVDEEGRPFTITAATAEQEAGTGTPVVLRPTA